MAWEEIPTRRWEGAVDWMADYIDDHTPEEVAGMLIHLASNVSDEVIEGLFCEEMAADGYFEEVTDQINQEVDKVIYNVDRIEQGLARIESKLTKEETDGENPKSDA